MQLSSVLYASTADDTSPSLSGFAPIDYRPQVAANPGHTGGAAIPEDYAYKLTIPKTSSTFGLADGQSSTITATPKETITIGYKNATTSGNNNYMCATIRRDNNNDGTDNKECYHGRFKPNGSATDYVTQATGTVTMTLPNLPVGSYKLVLYNEQNTGVANKTILAEYDEIALNIEDNTAPTVTYYRFTASDDGVLSKITDMDSNDSTRRDKLKDFSPYIDLDTVNVGPTVANSGFYVYDDAGDVASIPGNDNNVAVDSTPPEITNVRYNEGRIIVAVADSQSGVWKITNADGSVVLEDYS